jgi:hypothetical protein
MGHEHGSEYQLKIVLQDGTEDLTGWLNEEELVRAIKAARARAKAFWLQERILVCVDCADREPRILEYPLAVGESSRCRPHDSKYLVAAGVRNRSAVFPPR